jgi:hypothetical protein
MTLFPGTVMRLFFVLVSKHDIIPDWKGVEVADVQSAQIAAREVLEDLREDPSLDLSGWTLRAVDSSGSIAFSLVLDDLEDGSQIL